MDSGGRRRLSGTANPDRSRRPIRHPWLVLLLAAVLPAVAQDRSPQAALSSGVVALKPVSSADPNWLWLVPSEALPGNTQVLANVGPRLRLIRGTGASLTLAAPLRPALKLAPGLVADLAAPGPLSAVTMTVIAAPDRGPQSVAAELRRRLPGMPVSLDYTVTPAAIAVEVTDRHAARIDAITRLPGVLWVERRQRPQVQNSASVGPIQANADSGGLPPTATPIWDQDLMGSGQVIAIADSGLDRNEAWFTRLNQGVGVRTALTNAEMTQPPTPGTLFPTNKVLGYFVMPGATAYDNNALCGIGGNAFHGTHVTGTAAGDSGTPSTPLDPNHDEGDGMAPQAQILFQDLGDDIGGCLTGEGGGPMWAQARASGAFIHSNSYGSPFSGSYNVQDFAVDDFLWRNEAMLLLFAAGNAGGQPGDQRIFHFGHAKHGLTVGATLNGNNPLVWSQSSRGPGSDGRIKPDIVAPGVVIRSARGDTNNTGFEPPELTVFSGTSMATPAVAGAAALARQYFVDGFYPGGLRNPEDATTPSGVLLKSVLLNGTRSSTTTPEVDAGWGRVWLDSNLYFAGDARQLRIFDVPNAAGVSEGQTMTFPLTVSAGEPLRATLVWYDPAPSFVAPQALVNNLDLSLEAAGQTWLGNQLAGGESVTGGAIDVLNSVEQILLPSPAAGDYTVRVTANGLTGNGESASLRQGFALAVSSAQCDTGVVDAPGITVSTDAGGVQVSISAVAGAAGYQVYRRPGDCGDDGERLVGAVGDPAFEDLTAQGGLSYAYRVRGVDGCGEGPVSVCRSVVSQGPCTLSPTPVSAAPVLTVSDTFCAAELTWDVAGPTCSGANIRYAVYRSTDPFFLPSAATLLAANLTETRYSDFGPSPDVTHYYRVVAEDSLGNQAPPSAPAAYAAVAKDLSQPGPYVDGAELLSLALMEPPWQISSEAAASGGQSYASAQAGLNYPDNVCAALTTRPMVLSAGASLSYAARFDLENDFDGVVTEVSVDGGPWQDLPPATGYPGSFALTGSPPINACGYPSTQGAFNGSSGGMFLSRQSDLSAFAGSNVQLRWRLSSDSFQSERGFFLDDIQITGATRPAACVAEVLLFASGFE
ncbi:MAG: S8 family serine peptidase [Pseudomonadota bacterium]